MPVRQRLLNAGRDLFASRGFDAVSVREITARAKANLGAITYHFGSKEALYHAAIDSIAAPFAAMIADVAQGPGSPLDRIEKIVRAALSPKSPQPGIPPMLLRELAGDRPLPPPMARMMKRNLETVSRLIADGQKDGSIRAGDPALLAVSVVSQPFYFKIAGRAIEQTLGVPRGGDAWSHVIDHVVTSVRRTIAATPSQGT
ncbi:MAG TPA: TetR/AcrR family transcriptional regulator [Gemmatimonadaceae bacterium]|nr:TetR/AcrR family transcriptional regulator [Gemmatimonadaceae bacterium]